MTPKAHEKKSTVHVDPSPQRHPILPLLKSEQLRERVRRGRVARGFLDRLPVQALCFTQVSHRRLYATQEDQSWSVGWRHLKHLPQELLCLGVVASLEQTTLTGVLQTQLGQ